MFFYDGIMLHIGNYKDVIYIDSELIIIAFIKYKLKIFGECLNVVSLNDSELYIQGEVNSLELDKNI